MRLLRRALLLECKLDLIVEVSFNCVEFLLEGLYLFSEPFLGLLNFLLVHGFELAGGLQLLSIHGLLSSFQVGFTSCKVLAFGIEHLFDLGKFLDDRVIKFDASLSPVARKALLK